MCRAAQGGQGREEVKIIVVHNIVKHCLWIQIKFITKYSNAIHTIITTR
jgi:hypothetical protein